jgi:hypothetical protein
VNLSPSTITYVTSDVTKVIVEGKKIPIPYKKNKNLPPPSTTPTTIIVTAFYGWKEVLSLLPPPSTGVRFNRVGGKY